MDGGEEQEDIGITPNRSTYALPVQAGREHELCGRVQEVERDVLGGDPRRRRRRWDTDARSPSRVATHAVRSPSLARGPRVESVALLCLGSISPRRSWVSPDLDARSPTTDAQMGQFDQSKSETDRTRDPVVQRPLTTGNFILDLLDALRPGIVVSVLVIRVQDNGDYEERWQSGGLSDLLFWPGRLTCRR